MRIGEAFCKVLGLDPQRVRAISMQIDVGEIAAVDIQQFIDSDEVPGLVEKLTEYVLVPKALLGQIRVFEDVTKEREDQDLRWGPVRDHKHGLLVWHGIIAKQLGQLADRALRVNEGWGDATRGEVRHEAVQVAACAIALIEQMDLEAANG